MNKSRLLTTTSIILGLFTAAGCSNETSNTKQISDSQNVSAQSTKKTQSKTGYQSYKTQKLASNSIGTCRTTPDILGPFYKANAPFRTNVRVANDKGIPLVVRGTVFGKNCTTPIAGALVEIWQADNDGNYDNDSDKFLYRASLKTDAGGKYELKTIIPQSYDIGNNEFRPEHLHFKVSAAGNKDLITQTYFKNDKFIPADPWASKPEAKSRILELKKTENSESLVTFDIHL